MVREHPGPRTKCRHYRDTVVIFWFIHGGKRQKKGAVCFNGAKEV